MRRSALGLSRSVWRRLLRRRKKGLLANLTIEALNSMWGAGPSHSSPSELQYQSQLTVLRMAARAIRLPRPCPEAVNELLQGEVDYMGGPEGIVAVAPYQKGLISLPDSVESCPRAVDVIDPVGRSVLEHYEDRMLRSDAQLGMVFEKQKQIRLYMDPKLKNSQNEYSGFIADLYRRGLVEWRSRAKSVVTPFFVWKKDRVRRRLILDCRRTNVMFGDCPKLKVAGGAKVSEIHLGRDEELFIGKSDVKDFFYNIRLTGDIVEYFALPAVNILRYQTYCKRQGMEFPEGLTHLLEQGISNVFPCFAAVAMGWSWAMYIAQRVHTHVVMMSTGTPDTNLLEDHVPIPVFNDHPLLLPYVDNLNVLGKDRDQVQRCLLSAVEGLRAVGFQVHEIEDACQSTSILGYFVNGKDGIVGCKEQKLSSLTYVWGKISRGGLVNGKTIERLLGHTIPFLMLFRPLLAVPNHLYRYCHQFRGERRSLWPSARREAAILSRLL
eukprot:3552436-Amphidinium_carterae.1